MDAAPAARLVPLLGGLLSGRLDIADPRQSHKEGSARLRLVTEEIVERFGKKEIEAYQLYEASFEIESDRIRVPIPAELPSTQTKEFPKFFLILEVSDRSAASTRRPQFLIPVRKST